MKRGFTFLEILMVLGVLAILATMITAAISNFQKQLLLNEAKATILAELNLARTQTLGSEENSQWGVHFETLKVVRFKGQTYSALDPANKSFDLPPRTQISGILLGGAAEIVFERLTGKASASGSITISLLSDASSSKIITIYSSGIAE